VSLPPLELTGVSRPPISGVPRPFDGGPPPMPMPMPGFTPPGPPGPPPGFSGCFPSSSPFLAMAAAAASSRCARRRRKKAHVMSERKATAAPMPMPALAPVLNAVALAEGTTGTGVPLAVGVAVGEEVMSEEAVVRLPELVADEDAGRVVVASVVAEEEGVCSASVTVPEPDASGRVTYVALDLKSE
jgi:hypothetical protein